MCHGGLDTRNCRSSVNVSIGRQCLSFSLAFPLSLPLHVPAAFVFRALLALLALRAAIGAIGLCGSSVHVLKIKERHNETKIN